MGSQSHFIQADNSEYRRVGVSTIWAEGVSSTADKTGSKPYCGVVWSPVIFWQERRYLAAGCWGGPRRLAMAVKESTLRLGESGCVMVLQMFWFQ